MTILVTENFNCVNNNTKKVLRSLVDCPVKTPIIAGHTLPPLGWPKNPFPEFSTKRPFPRELPLVTVAVSVAHSLNVVKSLCVDKAKAKF